MPAWFVDVLQREDLGHRRQAGDRLRPRRRGANGGAGYPRFVDGPSAAGRADLAELLDQVEHLAGRGHRHRLLVLVVVDHVRIRPHLLGNGLELDVVV